MAEQSPADQRARLVEFRHLSPDGALFLARVLQRCRRRLRHHHDRVADRRRHRAFACGLPRSLRQRAVVDLCAAVAALVAVAMGPDRARPDDSALADASCHRHAHRREPARRQSHLPVGPALPLAGVARARRRADARRAHGMDPCLCRHSFLAPHQTLVSRLAALSVRTSLAVADAGAGRLRRRRQRNFARQPKPRLCAASAARTRE